MPQLEWTELEIVAAVEAYLQMLMLEKRGERYNKSQFERTLLAGPLKERTTTQQRMQNISWVLQSIGETWIAGFKPLGNIGKNATIIERTLRSRLSITAAPLPLYPAVPPSTSDRTLPATGYWILVCNPTRWDADSWLKLGETELWYQVSKHNRNEVREGDLAAIRVSQHAGQRARVVALLEIMGSPIECADPDERGYVVPGDSKASRWRAPLRVVANLLSAPIFTADLPATNVFKHFHRALQTSSIPMSREAFAHLWELAGPRANRVTLERLADRNDGIVELEKTAQDEDPVLKERISKYIERGAVGAHVKALLGHKCQVCQALGHEPIAFTKRDGEPFAEAHHVQPVHLMLKGSLGASNIMVLCPNHHRQAHFGDVEIEAYESEHWIVRVDARRIEIPRGGLGLEKSLKVV
jgi:hypothetical protein